jgi:carbamoyltransferase
MPFAPATLAEHAHLYFKGIEKSPNAATFMTITFDCTEQMIREAPAAVHVDGTARPQIVSRERYPEFHKILTAYHELTGLSNIINTSFNMHEEPIVCTASNAVRAFQDSKLPYMALGDYLVEGVETTSPSIERQGLLSEKE